MRSDFASHETLDQRTQAQGNGHGSARPGQGLGAFRRIEYGMDAYRGAASGADQHAPRVRRHLVVGRPDGRVDDPAHHDRLARSDLSRLRDGRRRLRRLPTFPPSSKRRGGQTATVDIALSDESGWKHKGRLDFLDNEMDRSSGTIHARATMPMRISSSPPVSLPGCVCRRPRRSIRFSSPTGLSARINRARSS